MVDAVSAERLSKSQREEVLSAINNIHLALAPRIAVLSSPDVGQALAPNGFSDFTDLLRPFQDSIEGGELPKRYIGRVGAPLLM